eukprot:1159305-Pelagomonas_calceolata.AAC.9
MRVICSCSQGTWRSCGCACSCVRMGAVAHARSKEVITQVIAMAAWRSLDNRKKIDCSRHADGQKRKKIPGPTLTTCH